MQEDMFAKLYALSMNLPEDIERSKCAGDFEGAIARIDARLETELPTMLADRLKLEREILLRLPAQYPFTRAEMVQKIRELVPDFRDEEMDALELDNALDFLYVHGEKHYFKRAHRTLMKTHHGLAERAGSPMERVNAYYDEPIARIKKAGRMEAHIRMAETLQIAPEAFAAGHTYRVHLPVPRTDAQFTNVHILPEGDGATIAPATARQATVLFERKLMENTPFRVEYEYDACVHYVNPLFAADGVQKCYPGMPAPTQDDLSEHLPHIVFSPYLKALAAEIRGKEMRPVWIARRMYDFVTKTVKYSFMRDYLLIPGHAEYPAVNLKGDCGLQALLFITLCRISGIPARWQSGLLLEKNDIGWHDWAQFYVEPYGWLFADLSFGGSAYRTGNPERWNYYFGNLDVLRMAANCAYQEMFVPGKKYMRNDPYDNQGGEVETETCGLLPDEYETSYELLEYREHTPEAEA